MKAIICFTILLLTLTSITFSQSVLDYQTGTGIEVQPGADICADQVIINGTFSGGGTICGGTAYILNLTAFIEGFYNSFSNTMISDTIIIYLRNATTPFAIIDSARSILDISGVGTFIFFNVSNDTNYIVIKHRNSIETWSSLAIAFSSGTLTYDFTSAATQAYGDNMKQVDTSPIRFGIYSGDINQDEIIDISDISLVYNAAKNSVFGYVPEDVTGDDFVDVSDLSITYNNAKNSISVISPLTIDRAAE